MTNLISTDGLIKKAKKLGVDFGKGDPYNRLRYYTKIGWLPHMERVNSKGHYPTWVLDRLLLIEGLKTRGTSNEEIEKNLNRQNWKRNIMSIVSAPEIKTKVLIYVSFVMLTLIFSSELELIKLGKSKADILNATQQTSVPKQIIESGTFFVPKNEKVVFVKTNDMETNYKVYITFNTNIAPAVRYWVEMENPLGGFFIYLDKPVAENTEFSWWISE